MSYFSDLGLAEPILRALETKGYSDPTPIQTQAIPALLQGRDLLGLAQTGTGKTAAFSLPSLHRLMQDPKPHKNAGCRMLVLSPTRELAAQIADNIRGYAKYLPLTVQCIFGGVPVGKQSRALVGGCDILVATPGRLLDLIDQRALTLRHVEIFVLDEADQMMDLGFIVPLKRVAAMLPKERQSLFFSATMPQAIAALGKQFINDPVRVEVTPQATTAERVEQQAIFINQAEKQALLTLRLRDGLADGTIDRALVFTRTKHGADRVVRHLGTAGVNAAAIHGNKSQAQRTAAILGFRKGSVPVLVATDIAARGIDIPGVSHVFNYEIPNVPEQYVHRIGRTARAGASGIALSFVAPDEKPYIRDIEKLTGIKLVPQSLPEDFTKQAARLPLPAKKTAEEEEDARHSRRGPAGRGGGRNDGGRNNGPRSDQRRGDRPHGDRPQGARPQGDRPAGDRHSAPGSNWRPRLGPDGEPERAPRPEVRRDARPEVRPDTRSDARSDARPDPRRADHGAHHAKPSGDRRVGGNGNGGQGAPRASTPRSGEGHRGGTTAGQTPQRRRPA